MTELLKLNQKAVASFEGLPLADPLTRVAHGGYGLIDDAPARRALAAVIRGADPGLGKRIEEEYFACGPLELLLDDPTITEIIVNGGEAIWFERAGRLERHDDQFLSALSYRNFIARISREAGMQATLDCPFADGSWRDYRVHLIIPPASGDQAVMTLRRHPRNPWTLQTLSEQDWADARSFEVLEQLVKAHTNFLVVGGTGSGKTSVLNACLQLLPDSERVVIIEDTRELKAPNGASSQLLTRRDPNGHLREVDQSELVRQALRMRPDRIVMGEVRGPEAKDLLMAFATGHKGCMGTLHAENPRQALIRLEMLIQLGAPQWSLQAVRTLIWLSLQAVVVVGRTENGKRRLEGIYRISSLEDVGFLLERWI
jgi:pilus assembly protein CpaF